MHPPRKELQDIRCAFTVTASTGLLLKWGTQSSGGKLGDQREGETTVIPCLLQASVPAGQAHLVPAVA